MKPSKRQGNTRHILFIADFAYSSSSLILSGVVAQLSSRPDVELIIRGAHPAEADWECGIEEGVDGVVSCLGAGDPRAQWFVKGRRGPPVALVSANRAAPSARRRTVSFVSDAAAIGKAAAELFIRHDLASFGYVGARTGVSFSWDVARRDAFLDALAEKGFAADVYRPAPAADGAVADNVALADWLKALPKPCGLFVSYDVRAMNVLGICHATGISVPEQVQIVGVDNEPWICEKTTPTLTSIEPDFEGAGWRAADAILALTEPKSKCKIENVKCKIEGAKSTVLGVHEGVAYALLYNGILKDRSVNGGNVLTRKTLEVIQADLEGLDFKKVVVYGEACRLMAPTLDAMKIEFRQTPYDLVTRR